MLRNITIDRPSVRVGRFDRLPVDIEHSMTAVLEKEVNLARRLEGCKRDLEIGLDYTAVSAFRSIDRYASGLITTVNLGAYLRDQGHWASETELLAIIRRIDTNGDASVDQRELAEFLRPAAAPTAVAPPMPLPLPAEPLPPFMPPYSRAVDPLVPRRFWDAPYPYSRPLWYDPVPPALASPVRRTETVEVERGPFLHSPARTVKKTTYHTPAGPKTYSKYI